MKYENLTLNLENLTFHINYDVSDDLEVDGILGIMALLKDNEIDLPFQNVTHPLEFQQNMLALIKRVVENHPI